MSEGLETMNVIVVDRQGVERPIMGARVDLRVPGPGFVYVDADQLKEFRNQGDIDAVEVYVDGSWRYQLMDQSHTQSQGVAD